MKSKIQDPIPKTIRILIVDDHAIVLRGVEHVLRAGFTSVEFGEAQTVCEALQYIRKEDWDLVILDIGMPGRSGLEVLQEARQIRPKLPVLVLSGHTEDQYAVRVLKAGAAGYMTKDSASDELVQAVKKVIAGGKYVSSSLAEKLAFDLEADSEQSLHDKLSDREYEVLRWIAQGKTITEIGKDLSLSPKTISTYRTRILEKMRMKNNMELMQYAIMQGIVE